MSQPLLLSQESQLERDEVEDLLAMAASGGVVGRKTGSKRSTLSAASSLESIDSTGSEESSMDPDTMVRNWLQRGTILGPPDGLNDEDSDYDEGTRTPRPKPRELSVEARSAPGFCHGLATRDSLASLTSESDVDDDKPESTPVAEPWSSNTSESLNSDISPRAPHVDFEFEYRSGELKTGSSLPHESLLFPNQPGVPVGPVPRMQWDDTTAIIFFNGSEGATLQNLISSTSDPNITDMHSLLQYDVGVNTRGFTMELHWPGYPTMTWTHMACARTTRLSYFRVIGTMISLWISQQQQADRFKRGYNGQRTIMEEVDNSRLHLYCLRRIGAGQSSASRWILDFNLV